MAYDIQMNLPEGWQKEVESYIDESGAEVTHLEAHLFPEDNSKVELAMVDIYVGDMPEDTTAEDQAFSNYADLVGFDDDDPEDFNPIDKVRFNGKVAFCFSAWCEDESPMMFLSQEVKKGVLAVICCAARDADKLEETVQLTERTFRVK